MCVKRKVIVKKIIICGHVSMKKIFILTFSVFNLQIQSTDLWQFELNARLLNAVDNNNQEEIKLLLAKGAEVNARDYYGNTLLHHAACNNRKEVINLLLANGAAVNAKNGYGGMPLHSAASEVYSGGATCQLLAAGAEVNAKDNHGTTPLHGAAFWNSLESIRILLEAGAQANAKDNDGRIPLCGAAIWGHTEAIRLLLLSRTITMHELRSQRTMEELYFKLLPLDLLKELAKFLTDYAISQEDAQAIAALYPNATNYILAQLNNRKTYHS